MRWIARSFLLCQMLACGSAGEDEGSRAPSDPAAANGGANAPSANADGSAQNDGDAGGSEGSDASPEASSDSGTPRTDACNGHVALCARRFNEVVFAATHNAHAAREYGYPVVNANQQSGLKKQLEDGVRALLMDVYDDNGASVFCHGPCALKSTPHLEGLTILREFLETHPREVLTIIYQDGLSAARIAEDFATAKLDPYVFTHASGTPWPTLGEMIENNTRLVVTAESGRPPPEWFHHVWDEAWDTPYEFRAVSDFNCNLNRGKRENALFLLNHWLSSGFGSVYLPSEDGAKTANGYDVLYQRAKRCWDETADVPNFIAVDFYEQGDLFKVVDDLNALGGSKP